jgi:pimeloyl-ACP methyl ester carboxylesterase
VFARLDDTALRAYVEALAQPRADGSVELAYPPEWEAQIYLTAPHDLWPLLPRLRCPVMVLYGGESDTFVSAAVAGVRRALPGTRLHCIPGAGHLVPLECPAETAAAMLEFIGDP